MKITKKTWDEMDREAKYEYCGGLMSIDPLDEGSWTHAEKLGEQLVRLYDNDIILGVQQRNDAPSFFDFVGGKYRHSEDGTIELDIATGEQCEAAQTHSIEVANDTPEAEEFVAWLKNRGHDATVGRSGNYVDGVWTSCSAEASDIMRGLWQGYCNS